VRLGLCRFRNLRLVTWPFNNVTDFVKSSYAEQNGWDQATNSAALDDASIDAGHA
jgi:hypothetical protein